jgi:hypothetical protein
MSRVAAVAGAIVALAGLVIPIYNYLKGKAYDKAIKDYKVALLKRDNAVNADELYYWDGVCKETSGTARGLYPLRAASDLRRS